MPHTIAKSATVNRTYFRISHWLSVLAIAGLGLALLQGTSGDALAQKKAKKKPQAEPAKTVDTKSPAKTEKKSLGKLDGKILLEAPADYATLAKTIDQPIDHRLAKEEVSTSALCTDEEFIRRVYLDLVGVIPTADSVQNFLAAKEADKRAKLVDELLENPRYGKFFGEMAAKELLNKESNNKRLSEAGLYQWLQERFNGNMHWDKLTYEFITASGSPDQNGAVTFFIANNAPEKMTDKVTRNFLGVRLECAQCHNHPFTEYKQTQYWGMAAFFMNVSMSGNAKQAAKAGNSISVGENPGKGKKLKLPMEAKIVPPLFLSGGQPDIAKGEAYRPLLAKWLTSKDNPYFARAAVNKTWFHLFGRGLVHPHDDMHPDNPASHPDLLATMAHQFKQSDFDLKYLIRAICASKTYQRSSKPTGNNADDNELFSHALVRGLHPEQLYDSLVQVIGAEPVKLDAGAKKLGLKGQPVGSRQKFINFFAGDDGYKPLEYQAGIPQALLLMNAKQFNPSTKAIAQATAAGATPQAVIEYLYLATVSRRPTAAETQKLTTYVQKQTSAQTAYGDILWALLNSSEFALNH
jgi:hypothetical protein